MVGISNRHAAVGLVTDRLNAGGFQTTPSLWLLVRKSFAAVREGLLGIGFSEQQSKACAVSSQKKASM